MSDEQRTPPDQLIPASPEETAPTASAPKRKNKPGAGRPRVEINWQQFDAMCFSHATLREMADFFQCSTDTLERACKREFHQNFADVFRQKSARGKISLRRAQWDAALRRHDTRMMIWLGKQHLGQREVMDVDMNVAERYPITAEIEAKDKGTLEKEIASFLAGIDLAGRIRKAEAALKERDRKRPSFLVRRRFCACGSEIPAELAEGISSESEGQPSQARVDRNVARLLH
jgi:AraC-like DNA-binding protein